MPTTTQKKDSAVVSRDGTEIAFEQSGGGPAIILVASALADRSDARKLAGLLAPQFTVLNYDRRGRGASGDAAGYSVDREIEDIAALIDHAGGSASLFGSSSGAVLALHAAAALDVERLALYEPPLVVSEGFGPPKDFAQQVNSLLAAGRRGDAVKYFMTKAQGMPALMVNSMRIIPGVWSSLKKLAHTLTYDIAVMGDTQHGKPLDNRWTTASARTLVLTGGKSPAGFHDAARALAEILPDAAHHTLPGLNHGAVMMAPKKLAPTLVEFLRS